MESYERTGEVHDYTRRDAVDHTEILAPDDAPAWTQDRGRLWNEVEATETRKNSQVAREIVVALPMELAAGEQRELVRGFVAEQCVGRGMVADVAYHDIGSGNPHAHVLITTRRIGPDGFAGKDRSWNDRAVLQEWRQEWAAAADRALERAHSPERVDHRSLVAQAAAGARSAATAWPRQRSIASPASTWAEPAIRRSAPPSRPSGSPAPSRRSPIDHSGGRCGSS